MSIPRTLIVRAAAAVAAWAAMACLATLAALVSLAAVAPGAGVPVAQANPPPGFDDPHVPNMMMGNCPGGRGGLGSISYCDGDRYPDGSYWHQVLIMHSWIGPTVTMNCVTDPDNSPIPPVAPAGACNGTWDGQTDTGFPEPSPPPPDQPAPPPGPDQGPPPPAPPPPAPPPPAPPANG